MKVTEFATNRTETKMIPFFFLFNFIPLMMNSFFFSLFVVVGLHVVAMLTQKSERLALRFFDVAEIRSSIRSSLASTLGVSILFL